MLMADMAFWKQTKPLLCAELEQLCLLIATKRIKKADVVICAVVGDDVNGDNEKYQAHTRLQAGHCDSATINQLIREFESIWYSLAYYDNGAIGLQINDYK